MWWVWGLPIQSNYRAGCVPSQELVDAYDMLETGKPVLDLKQPYLDETHLQPNYTVSDLIENKELKKQLDLKNYISGDVGMPTLSDIIAELDKPGRDPRRYIEMMEFDAKVKTIDDLQEGMILNGIVTNITQFGCFVDIGIKENGLVHISQMADRYISNPTEIVSMHQPLKVRVIGIDRERKRIQLSLKDVS